MYYRTFGMTDLSVSILGFGTMRLPFAGIYPDFTQAILLIQHAIKHGINFFDVGTFYCHHHCEKAFGMAIREILPEKIIISGKNSTHQTEDSNWLQQLKNSLYLFNRNYFDIYFIHYLTFDQWQSYFLKRGVIHQIKEAIENGLIRHIGFSSHDKPDNVKKLIDTNFFKAVILPFNLLQREYEETMEYAHNLKLGVAVMNPLAGGALVDCGLHFKNINNSNIAEIALNYVLSKPYVDSALSGMESYDNMNKNIQTVNQKRLLPDEIINLESSFLKEQMKSWISCTSCEYCMPCTQGINIPQIIQIWNRFSVLNKEKIFSREFYALSVTSERCIGCNNCTSKCPQQINVPKIMEQASRRFNFIR